MNKPSVQVMLSTFNGEKYVIQQIDSIMKQKNVEVHLLVRDDGSSDSTVSLIERMKDNRIEIIKGKNVGSTKSFLKLIEVADEHEYYSFSDQDDVWDEDKLSTGIEAINDFSIPAIYSSTTRLVDVDLKPITIPEMNPKTDLASAFIKNYVAGCTAVFNKELMTILKQCKDPVTPFHDWWINIVALSVGGVSVFDKQSHMSYRQHEGNVVGAAETRLKVWHRRVHKFFEQNYRRDLMARSILQTYSNIIPSENMDILKYMADGKQHPIKMIKSGLFHTDNMIDDIAFYICALAKKI